MLPTNVVYLNGWGKPVKQTTIDRLDGLMRDRRWNKADLAKALGASPLALTGWWKRGEIPGNRLTLVAKLFNVSIEFLVSGNNQDNDEPNSLDEVFQNLTQAQQDQLLASAKEMSADNERALAIAKELQARRK